MPVNNVWTTTNMNKVISYRMQYASGDSVYENIKSLHREIVYAFGGTPLDISLNSNNTMGSQLSVSSQRLDDRAVFDVCSELMHGREDDGSIEFADTASMIFDWVYIQAVIQTFDGVPDLLDFTHFTNVKSKMGVIYSSARAVAELKLLNVLNRLEIIDRFETFSVWHADTVISAVETPRHNEDYRILNKDIDHVSIISRLPKNIFEIVADKSEMLLWENDGRYIIYDGEFNNSWISDFLKQWDVMSS